MRMIRGGRSWRGWLWFGALSVVGLALAGLPLVGVLGYEASFVLALFASLASIHLGVRSIVELRERLSSVQRLDVGARPLAWTVRTWARGSLRALALLLVPTLILVANALRVRNCNLPAGLAWTLLLPGISTMVGTAVGLVAGLAVRRSISATALGWSVVVVSVVWGLVRFYVAPPVFAYDPFLGYFPGALYDEEVGISRTLLLARAFHLLLALATLLTAALFLDGRSLSLRASAARHGRKGLALLALSVGVLALAAWRLEPRLGLAPDAASIAAELGGRRETEHFVVLYSPVGPWARDLEVTLEDLESHRRQLTRKLGVAPRRKITCYLFGSSEEKRRAMGAGQTQVAKPWRYEIYLQFEAWPHAVLKHELAHVFAGEIGDPLLHLSRRGLRFNMGLIEGVATALAERPAPLDLDQQVKVMRRLGVEPSLERLFGAGFLAQPAARAYAVAGSFVRFLIDEEGPERFTLLYRSGGDFAAAYGRPLDQLRRAWSERIDGVEVSDVEVAAESERLRAPGVWHKVCAHELALRRQAADAELARGDAAGAAAIYRSICDDDPGDPRHLLEWMAIEAQAHHEAEVRAAGERVLAHPRSLDSQKARVWTLLGDGELRRGKRAPAADYYRRALALPQRESQARQLRARLVAATHPSHALGEALGRYLVGDGLNRDSALDLWHAQRVIDAAPEEGLGYYLLGRQLFARRQWREAAQLLERALARPLPDAGFRAEDGKLAGMAWWRAGERASARRNFAQVAGDSTAPREARIEARGFLER